jgi:uncharacterized membrane protein YqiK
MHYVFLGSIFLIGLVVLAVFAWLIKSSCVYIGNGTYGVVEKLWAFSSKKRTSFLALKGEPGYQPELLYGGFHFFFPFQYRVLKQPMITNKGIAYLFARDGKQLTEGQALAQWPEGVAVEDARAFLESGGQSGPQRFILRQGLHAVNTALFAVFTEEGIFTIDVGENAILGKINDYLKSVDGYNPITLSSDGVGVVTVNDGDSLEHGEIVAPTVKTTDHNSFQSIEKFLSGGGKRGRQEQVLVEGVYYINRLFATVEMFKKVVIPVGNVGVINSYAGPSGVDISGQDYTHGQLVRRGEKGIWSEALPPGKYAINPYAMSVATIPTTNLVLRWEKGSAEGHGFDRNLSEIKLITKDAFEPIVGLSLVIHIGKDDAPYVIQQFADIQMLVDQTLDTIVSSWFKDAVQDLTLIEFINTRAELQLRAKEAIAKRFLAYKLSVQEIMLGTPRSDKGDDAIEVVFTQLRERQLSVEQTATFKARQLTVQTEKEFNEAQAIASNQTALTTSKIAIEIAENNGSAELAKRTKEAQGKVVTAEADAKQTTLLGNAEAEKIKAIGQANADAAQAQVEAYGGAEFALRKSITEIIAQAYSNSGQPNVPQVMMGGANGSDAASGLANLLATAALAGGKIDGLLPEPN